jgi:release factor glutamine methyltransferase
MILENLKKEFVNKLSVIYSDGEILFLFKILCEEYLKIPSFKLLFSSKIVIKKSESDLFFNTIIRLLNEEPIQYILEKTSFYGLNFVCSPSALIPRPETEELVDWIVKSESAKITILDIGTGNGCISVSLANNGFIVDALDISYSALDLAKKNAFQNKVDINFIEADIFNYDSNKKYDLIVSNPPYVRESEKKMMSKNVLNFEPSLALFVDDIDPLKYYNAILKFANNNLEINGKIYFEINEYLYNDMKELLLNYGYTKINIKKDIFKKNRFISAILKKRNK